MIKLENISKKIGDKVILKNITLEFQKGELTFISGTSGAGKSTLLNLIGGLDYPSEGRILCDNIDINSDLYAYRAEKVGFVFQEANLISGLSVTQNVVIATELSGVTADRSHIAEGICELGIQDPQQRVETLSGGEKQRVAVLRSLYKDAELILADEPTGSLDSENARNVFETLRKLANEKCVIVISHDIALAEQYADRVVTLRDGQIIEEKTLRTRNEVQTKRDIQRESTKLNREVVLPLGKNSIRLRKGKIASIVATISMAITAIAMVIGIAGIGNQITGSVNVNYLESDLINAFYGSTANTAYGSFPFTEADQNYIESREDIKEVVWQYYRIDSGWFFQSEKNEAEACIKQINIDEFFRDRVMSNDIVGRFPNNEDEIILAADVAKKLFGNDSGLGQEVVLNGSSGQNIQFSVVGINHTKNPYDKIYSFVSANRLKQTFSDELQEGVFQRQEIDSYRDEIQMGLHAGGLYGNMRILDGSEKLLYGAPPEAKNQILISSTLLSYGLQFFELDKKYTPADALQGKISEKDFAQIVQKRLAIDCNGVFEVVISGVFISNDVELRYTSEMVEELQKPDPVVADIYVKDSAQAALIKDELSSWGEFEAETNQETLKRAVMSQSLFFEVALVALGIILVWISILLLNSYSRIAVLERRKEIAILKSLGAKDRTVLKVLLFDSGVIDVLSLLCAFVLTLMARSIVGCFVPQIATIGLLSTLLIVLMVAIVFAAFIFALTFLVLRKFVHKMPAELFLQQ